MWVYFGLANAKDGSYVHKEFQAYHSVAHLVPDPTPRFFNEKLSMLPSQLTSVDCVEWEWTVQKSLMVDWIHLVLASG